MPIYKNWKDPEAYNFTEKLSFLGWTWEFLRRNEEYQQDWLYKMKKFFSGERLILNAGSKNSLHHFFVQYICFNLPKLLE